MNKDEILNYYNIKPQSIKKIRSVSIITCQDKRYVIKKVNRKTDSFDYLLTRNFNNFPKVYSSVNDEIELTDYVEDKNIPIEQKLEDLVYITSILHNKTTYFKNIDDDYLKNIYENTLEKLESLYNYYFNLQDMIEMEVYMSPANYLLIRNISNIYKVINISRDYVEKWYQNINNSKKIRLAYIHGNLDKEHLIENDDLYLISWDKSRIDLPIYDLEILYRKNFLDITLNNILEIYSLKYPLSQEEYYLFMALVLIPDKIDMNLSEYSRVKQITNLILYIEKTLEYLENNTNKTN